MDKNFYHTVDTYPRAFFDKVSMGTSLYFAVSFLAKLVGNRQLAMANKFDTKT